MHNKEANFCSTISPKSKARENIIMCGVPVFTLAHTIIINDSEVARWEVFHIRKN